MLPEDILVTIFSFLSPHDLIIISQVCRTFNELSHIPYLWKKIVIECYWGSLLDVNRNDWWEIYKEFHCLQGKLEENRNSVLFFSQRYDLLFVVIVAVVFVFCIDVHCDCICCFVGLFVVVIVVLFFVVCLLFMCVCCFVCLFVVLCVFVVLLVVLCVFVVLLVVLCVFVVLLVVLCVFVVLFVVL
jgi:hypothetical protein